MGEIGYKVCTNCPCASWCWEESWEKGINYCYRDKEVIVVRGMENEGLSI